MASDMDVDDFTSDENEDDEESELNDLEQLSAVLESDKEFQILASESFSQHSSYLQSAVPVECSAINKALALNRMADEKLRRLEKVLTTRLQKCHQRLNEIQNKAYLSSGKEGLTYIFCGKPYFKDKLNYPAPDNEDTIIMKNSEMFDISTVMSNTLMGWTLKDKTDFITLIEQMSIEIRTNELKSKIRQLKRENITENSSKLDRNLRALNREIEQLSKRPLSEIVLPIDHDYDWLTIANKLNLRHSASEYEALWKLFLHPAINKSGWSKSEHTALQRVAHDHKSQDWEKISKELKTGRSAYQCFVYFRTNVSNTLTGQKWTTEEEEYLKRLIEFYKEGNFIPWGKVASHMEHKNKVQVYNKYTRLHDHRKGRFLEEEDAVILTCVDNFGRDFKKIAEYLPGRSSSQVRIRYNIIMEKKHSVVWTVAEDKLLVKLMSNHNALTNFSEIAKHFDGKTRVNLRSRYKTLMKFMVTYPNTDLEHAPRRGPRHLSHGNSADNLNKAIEKLKKRVQEEVVQMKKKIITLNSLEENIEQAIVEALRNEKIEEERESQINSLLHKNPPLPEINLTIQNDSEPDISLKTLNIFKILLLLRAKLNKKKFLQSDYSKMYPGLMDNNLHDSMCSKNKIKSYSKKAKSEKELKPSQKFSIWGDNTLGARRFLLPPNYATIIGCQKLMVNSVLHNTQNSVRPINFSVMLRRNLVINNIFITLRERFNFLFIWPMMLSNREPDFSRPAPYIRSNPKNLDMVRGVVKTVAVPKFQSTITNDNIDLDESEMDEVDINLQEVALAQGLCFVDKKIKKEKAAELLEFEQIELKEKNKNKTYLRVQLPKGTTRGKSK